MLPLLFGLVVLLLFPALADPPPPLLTDPRGALARVEQLEDLQRAEVLILTGHPKEAITLLKRLGREETKEVGRERKSRRLRLSADASAMMGDRVAAAYYLRDLSQMPGWFVHASIRTTSLEKKISSNFLSRLGLGLFALCLALMILGGGRELLRPSLDTVLFAAAVLAALLLSRIGSVAMSTVVGLLGAGMFALVHGTSATIRRTDPVARGKVFLAALLLLGVGGLLLAIFTQFEPVLVDALFS